MSKLDKILNKTIADKGEFWKTTVLMIVVATLLVTAVGTAFKACSASLVEAAWTTPGETEQAEDQGGE